jgi:hypothetical protein
MLIMIVILIVFCQEHAAEMDHFAVSQFAAGS